MPAATSRETTAKNIYFYMKFAFKWRQTNYLKAIRLNGINLNTFAPSGHKYNTAVANKLNKWMSGYLISPHSERCALM